MAAGDGNADPGAPPRRTARYRERHRLSVQRRGLVRVRAGDLRGRRPLRLSSRVTGPHQKGGTIIRTRDIAVNFAIFTGYVEVCEWCRAPNVGNQRLKSRLLNRLL